MRPQRRDGLLTEEVGDEVLVFDHASNTAAALNHPAAAVFDLCDGTRSVDEIVAALESSSTPLGVDEVLLALAELDDSGLLVEAPAQRGPSRRDLLAKLGVTAAGALMLPVVEAIVAPTPAAAASGVPLPTPQPTPAPPTPAPTPMPTNPPTPQPTQAPPTPAPTPAPPTPQPTNPPTPQGPPTPQPQPTPAPPTPAPTPAAPTKSPTPGGG